IVKWSRLRIFRFELLANVFVFNCKGSAFRNAVIQRLKTLLLMLHVFRGSNEFLNGFYVEQLMNVVVVSQEIRRDFPRAFELAVFSDDGLDFFDKRVFGVIAGDIESSVVRILKFFGIGELDDPRRDWNGAVRSRLIKTDF